jgi:hypothetical protein
VPDEAGTDPPVEPVVLLLELLVIVAAAALDTLLEEEAEEPVGDDLEALVVDLVLAFLVLYQKSQG